MSGEFSERPTFQHSLPQQPTSTGDGVALPVNWPKAIQADYYDVCYLKQAEKDGPWAHGCASFPTEAAAEEHAGILREGRHGAVRVVPRWWPR